MNSTVVNHNFNIEPLQTVIIVLSKYLVHMNHTTFRVFLMRIMRGMTEMTAVR